MIKSNKKTIYEALGREPVHPFPARMAPGIALDIIEAAEKPIRVLDPMMGSGTVLAVARAKGHKAVGVDIDPLAVLVSKVWTTSIDSEEVRDKAIEVLARAREDFTSRRDSQAYPRSTNPDTRRFVAYWFDAYARKQLAALAAAIERVRNDKVRDVLWCGFSRLIITKQAGASLAMDLAHSRPHKSFDRAPIKPFRKFISAVDRVVENCIKDTDQNRGPAPSVYLGDARQLPIQRGTVDLVLTSPPYLNAIDYMRCSKFSLIWMGHTIDQLSATRSRSVGTEVGNPEARDDEKISEIITELNLCPRLSDRHEAILARYIDDMRCAICEVARVLARGGKAVYVVGENTIRGTYIRNSLVISAVAELSGLTLEKRCSRILPANRRYLPPPSNLDSTAALDTRMRREVILTFSKAASCSPAIG
jgi:DNA modification methylase